MTRKGRQIGLGAILAVFVAAFALVGQSAFGSTAAQTQYAPKNTTPPTITGTAADTQTLTANVGTWTGDQPIVFSFQWQRCTSAAQNCVSIAGATTQTYLVGASDVGGTLRVTVTARNSAGSASVISAATGVVAPAPGPAQPAPKNTTPPTITGTAADAQTLTANVGTWSGNQPIVFTYQWQRCNGGGQSCASVSGATAQTYTAQTSDVGGTLRVAVTARNSQGSAEATSAATGVVAPAPGPIGAIKLPNGETSIPVTSVPAGQRLIVNQVSFNPSPVRSRTQPIQARIKVKDTRGYVVRDAVVFIRSTPLVTTAQNGGRTQQDGTIVYTMQPESDFPSIRNGYSVQFFVKAYRQGDDPLAGITGSRLVQVSMSR